MGYRIRPYYARPASLPDAADNCSCSTTSDPGMEDLLYEAESVRRFVGLISGPLPDETTILNFRHLLQLGEGLWRRSTATWQPRV